VGGMWCGLSWWFLDFLLFLVPSWGSSTYSSFPCFVEFFFAMCGLQLLYVPAILKAAAWGYV